MSWPTVLASLLASLLGGGGTVAIINALAKRRVTRVEAADRLNESTLEWADKLQAHAESALKEADNARRETAALRQEVAAVRREAEALAWELRRLRLAITDPTSTVDRLRMMIGDPGANGLATALDHPRS